VSNEAPTDALRMDEAQRTAIEHAAMDANADVWRHCRLAMVADEEIVGYPCFSRADMAELARLYEAAPASPLPGGGAWSAIRNAFVRHAEAFVKASRYEEASAIADKAAREIQDLISPLPAAPTGEPK
jgi:hypothetical protein